MRLGLWTARRVGIVLAVALAATLLVAPTVAAGQLDPPTDLRVTHVNHSSATFEWEGPPGSSESTFYRLELTRGTERIERHAQGPRLSVINLVPDQTYQVRVETAYFGNWSEPIEVRTIPAVALPTPTNVRATVSPGSVTVEWDPSFRDGVEADWYVLRWTPQHTGGVTTAKSVTRSMPSGGELSVTVAARRGLVYESEPSEPLHILVPPHPDWEPLGAPSNLRVVADDAGVVQRLEWDPAPGGMDPVTYTISYRFGDQPHLPFFQILDSDQPFLDIPDFIGRLSVCGPNPRPGDVWILRVNAHSHGKVSEPSNEVTVCF